MVGNTQALGKPNEHKAVALGIGVGDWPEGLGNERKKDAVSKGRRVE